MLPLAGLLREELFVNYSLSEKAKQQCNKFWEGLQ